MNTEKDLYTSEELLVLAAGNKGVGLRENTSQSKAIKSYALNSHLLSLLKEEGVEVRSEPQYVLLEYAGGRWKCAPSEGKNQLDLHIDLEVMADIRQEYRGVLLVPHVWGCGGCSVNPLPHKYLFELLVQHDPEAPEVADEIAKSDGGLVVTWTELGLGGLRSLEELFREFFGGKDAIERIARNGLVFDPLPYQRFHNDGEIFAVEPAQPGIVKAWQEQLEAYRSKLVA